MIDASGPLTLEELAKQLAPREFTTWRRRFDVLTGKVEMPSRWSDCLVRIVAAAADQWRTALIRDYTLDDHLLPRAPLLRADISFMLKLLATPVLENRQALIVEEAGHRATSEVAAQWRERFRFRAAQNEAKVVAAVADALREKGTVISGVEIVSSPVGQPIRRRRSPVPADFLANARIDILAGTLDEGGRQWCHVVAIRKGNADVDAAAERTGSAANEIQSAPAASLTEIGDWMVKEQAQLRAAGRLHGRNLIWKLAMTHFSIKQETARAAWNGRPVVAKRK